MKSNIEFPELFQKVIKRYPKIWESYERLGESVRSIKGLDERSQNLVKLGIAIGSRSEGAVHSHVRKCKKAGMSNEEIYHAGMSAITTMGWPQSMAVISWINDILKDL